MTNYVTYGDLLTFALVIVGVIALLLSKREQKPSVVKIDGFSISWYLGDGRHREAAILLYFYSKEALI